SISCCFLTPTDDEHIDLIEELAHETVDAWLAHLDEAEPVPEEERFALSARDLAVRRNVAERDPANVMGVRYFGEEMTERLVRALWGADRRLPGAS
ncbi:MAG: oxidoreductase, partial [Actinomycetota bacterium]